MFERRPSDSRIDLSGLRIRSGFSAGGVVRTYATILRDDYGASEIWPLVNISAGTTISAFVNLARNGSETGWALQNTAGPVPGTLAPFSDGTNDFGNIYTSGGGIGLADIFNPSEGSLIGFAQVSGSGVWVDGVARTLIRLRADNNNEIRLRKPTTNNQIEFRYVAGGTVELPTATISSTGIFSFGLSWSIVAGEVRAYIDGTQIGVTATGLGTWVGALNSTSTAIGAQANSAAAVWSGWLSYIAVKFGSIWTPAQFAAMHTAASTAGPDL